ncbi:MAG: WD40 repeat domain-containing protein [Planctomycetaceae bacterium]
MSDDGQLAVQSDQVYIFDVQSRRLLRTISADPQTQILSAIEAGGERIAFTRRGNPGGGPLYTTEIRDRDGNVRHRYRGAFLGFASDGSVLTSDLLGEFSFPAKRTLTRLAVHRQGAPTVKVDLQMLTAALSGDGKSVTCLVGRSEIQIRNSQTLGVQAQFQIAKTADDVPITAQAIGGSDDVVVAAGRDLWRYRRTGEIVWQMTGVERVVVSVHKKRPIAVARGFGKKLHLIDLEAGQLLRQLNDSRAIQFGFGSKDLVVTLGQQWNGPRIFDGKTGLEVQPAPISPAKVLTFKPRTHDLLSVSKRAFIWNLETRRTRFTAECESVDGGFSRDGRRVYTRNGPNFVWLDSSTGQQIEKANLTRHDRRTAKSNGYFHVGGITKTNEIAFTDPRKSAWLVSMDGAKVSFSWLSRESGKAMFGTTRYQGFEGIRLRPNSSEIVLLSDGWVTFFDMESRKRRDAAIPMDTDRVFQTDAMTFIDKNRFLVRLQPEQDVPDTRLGLFDSETLEQKYAIQNDSEQFENVVFSSDGKYLICVGRKERADPKNLSYYKRAFDHGLLRVFDAASGDTIATWRSGRALTSVAISDDSKLVALGTSDSTIRIVDLAELVAQE